MFLFFLLFEISFDQRSMIIPLNGPEHCATNSPEIFLDGTDHCNHQQSDFSIPWLVPKDPSFAIESDKAVPVAKRSKRVCLACVIIVLGF